MASQRASWSSLLPLAARRFVQDDCLQIASSLTFTTLLAFVPVLTVALTLVSAFPVFSPLVAQAQQFVVANFMPASVNAIAGYAELFSRNAAGLTTIGILFLGVTALMLVYTIESAFNEIWKVTWQRAPWRRLLIYSAALTIGPLMIGASLTLTSHLIATSAGLAHGLPWIKSLLLNGTPLALSAAAFALAYWAVPNRHVRARDAMAGGASAGILFELMKHGFGLYVTHFPSDQLIYGAFALVPIFLLWIYLSWLIVLGGAVLTAVMPDWRSGTDEQNSETSGDFFHAMQALYALVRGYHSGKPVLTSNLHSLLRLRLDRLEWMLDRLCRTGLVARKGRDGWVLRRAPDSVKVMEIYRAMGFDPYSAALVSGGTDLHQRLRALTERSCVGMDITLSEFFAPPATIAPTPESRGTAPKSS